ncbi:PelD GGDEF domain-containing protein [Thiobacter aerophilum]|uniref:PelD GGDEF domain-containing protein n=1 Tax=Thiobacter aerophilum TaxID=3121275 RepID=A0ABV0EG70_9BURK
MWEALKNRWAGFASQPAAAGETLAAPLLAVGLGLWLSPLDPFWTRAGFPWAWLAPVLVSLRYGSLAGLAASGVLVLAWLLLAAGGWPLAPFPRLYFLGGFILVMLTGEFTSLWLARARRAETLQAYLDERLERLTEQYYLLRLSHDKLEQELLTRPMTLRDALGRLVSEQSPETHAQALMDLLAQYCQLERAALYAIHDGVLVLEPLARVGEPFPLDPLDPLVRHALDNERLAHVRHVTGETGSRYRVVAPAAAQGEGVTLLLVVERLPFLALHEETLQSLELLLNYYADGMAMTRLAAPILARYPECPPSFALELERLYRLATVNGIASSLMVFRFSTEAVAADLPHVLARQSRGLDLEWFVAAPIPRLLVILPLTGEAGAEGYARRIEHWFAERGSGRLSEVGVTLERFCLDAPPLKVLARVLETQGAN